MSDYRTRVRECESSVEIATAVLCKQFPELAPHAVTHLASGWDHDAFEVNGEWIVRMPMRAEVPARMPVELGALQLAGEVMSLEVPRISLRGVPCARYPFPFTGYRKLRGVAAGDVPLDAFCTNANANAWALGRALGALHRVPVTRAQALATAPRFSR